jgi:hypothetical protein
LYRAIPFAVKEQNLRTWERETKQMVDKAYRAFWKKRGVKPPEVSNYKVGIFETLTSKGDTK